MSGPDIRTVNERVLPVGLKSIVRIGQRARVAIVVSILALVALGVPQVVAQSVAPQIKHFLEKSGISHFPA